MAIEQMKLLTITGYNKNLDKFLGNVLVDSDLQIEDAKKVYNKGWKLDYYEYDYKIKDALRKCETLLNKLEIPYSKKSQMSILRNRVADINEQIENLNTSYEESIKTIEKNRKENQESIKLIEEISKLQNIDIDFKKLYDLTYIKFRYGSIPAKNLEDIKKELENLNVIMFEVAREQDLVWIMYFTTTQFVGSIDGIFNIQKFERRLLPNELIQTPKKYILDLKEKIRQREFFEIEAEEKINRIKKNAVTTLLKYYRELQTYEKINIVKKYIVHDQNDTFYIVAWVPQSSINQIQKQLSEVKDIDFVIKPGKNPPTKLKNSKIVRPFENLVRMYGMPKMNELDPTWFVAISTFIMFGFMFGDVGHGLSFLILGILLFIKKKKVYGAILFAGGFSSMIFGVLYGSVFGKEDIIKPILISPMNDINTMLVYGVIVGTVFIMMAMILNIANGIKNRDIKRIFLDENGIAGIALYSFILACVAYYIFTGSIPISTSTIVIIAVILVLIIMFNDKIMQLIKGKKDNTSTPFVEKVFEIIEMILSFLSNTISFLRLAAFAINHAGLCMAVYLLANMSSGAGNIVISIIGNIVVLVLEGLIVGIQTLRLEYYELFSRFYDGSGREYRSIKTQLEE